MATAVRERIQKKSLGFVIKDQSDAAQGIVTAVVNVFGIIDTAGDIIHKGAYTKTLNERKTQIRTKVLDNHQTNSVLNIVAKALDIYEVGRDGLPAEVLAQFPSATGGLVCKMQFMLDDPTNISQGIFKRIDFGASNEYSIGLEIVEQNFSVEKGDDGRKVQVRNIRQLSLFDVSPVCFGANEGTITTEVKNMLEKAVTKFQDLPLAARDRAWDASGADKRVRAWADAEDAPNDKYANAFFWHDSDNADNFTAYKLQYADVVDGKLTAIPRGIIAVAGVLNGARGGVDIPDADKASIKTQVGKYYDKMAKQFDDDSIVVPWQADDGAEKSDELEDKDMSGTNGTDGGYLSPNESPSKPEERDKRRLALALRRMKRFARKNGDGVQTVGSWLMGAMIETANDCIEDLLSDGEIDITQYQQSMNAIMEGLQAFDAAMPAEIADMPYECDDDYLMPMWWSREAPAEAKTRTNKEGRKFSSSTKDTLNGVHKDVTKAMDSLRTLIDDTGVEAEPFGTAAEDDDGKDGKDKADKGHEAGPRNNAPTANDRATLLKQLDALTPLQLQ